MSKQPYENLFVLPNGSCLKYALPEDYGKQSEWFRTRNNDRLVKSDALKKESKPRLGLWNSGSNQFVLAADFDKYKDNTFKDFEFLFSSCEHLQDSICTYSVRGRVKVFFVVELEGINTMTGTLAAHLLKNIFTDNDRTDLISIIDSKTSAMSVTFLDTNIIKAITGKLSSLKPYKYSKEFLNSIASNATKEGNNIVLVNSPFIRFKGDITEPKLLKFIKRNAKKEDFIRLLLGTSKIIHSIDLPIRKICKELGVSTGTVHNYIQKLIELNLLVNLNEDSYIVGVHAKSYKAVNELLKLAEESNNIVSTFILPTVIKDGEWYKTLYRCVPHFKYKSLEEFLKWVRSIPNWDKKPERIRNAIGNWKQMMHETKNKSQVRTLL